MNAGKEFIKEAYRAIFQKDYQRAIELFKKAIQRDSNNPTYYYKLSVTYARNNNVKQAIMAVEEALKLRPDNSLYQQHLQILKGREMAKQAMEEVEAGTSIEKVLPLLEASIHLDPINTRSRLLYAWLLHESGQCKEAIMAIRELLALDPWHKEGKEFLKLWTTNSDE